LHKLAANALFLDMYAAAIRQIAAQSMSDAMHRTIGLTSGSPRQVVAQ
jgi:hypothetical protein